MDTLQGDIDALEREKTELRERVKELSRKTLMEGIVRQSSAGQTRNFVMIISIIRPFYVKSSLFTASLFMFSKFFTFESFIKCSFSSQ